MKKTKSKSNAFPSKRSNKGNVDEIYIECKPTGQSGEILVEQSLGKKISKTNIFNKKSSLAKQLSNVKMFLKKLYKTFKIGLLNLSKKYPLVNDMLESLGNIMLSILIVIIISTLFFPLLQGFLTPLLNDNINRNSITSVSSYS